MKLTMLQGVPGCGKTTYALAQCAKNPNLLRVNKDDIRKRLLGVDKGTQRDPKDVKKTEREVVIPERDRLIEAHLRGGWDVIVDDTNLAGKHEQRLRQLAQQFGADFEIVRIDTPLEECLRRNNEREPHERVPKAAIYGMWKDMHPGQELPKPTFAPYVADKSLQSAVLIDLDGTLSLSKGLGPDGADLRNPYDGSKCHLDVPNEAVLIVIGLVGMTNIGRALAIDCDHFGPAASKQMRKCKDIQIILLSGRDEKWRPQTLEFLTRIDCQNLPLFMRPAGDCRPDWVIKGELFDRHIRGQYNVHFILDDRDQVVDFWRSLGLTCFQVAPGAF